VKFVGFPDKSVDETSQTLGIILVRLHLVKGCQECYVFLKYKLVNPFEGVYGPVQRGSRAAASCRGQEADGAGALECFVIALAWTQ
jgi:hypothetical protein